MVHDFVVKLLRNPSRLDTVGDGWQAKPYIAVGDLVDGIRRAVAGAARSPMTILNLGTEGTLTVRDVAAIVIEALDLDPDSVELAFASGSPDGGGWPGDTVRVALDTSAIRSFGWRPALTAAEAVRATALAIAARYRAGVRPLLTAAERWAGSSGAALSEAR